jgi:hypothetical protein
MDGRESAEARSLAVAWALSASALRGPVAHFESALGDPAFLREAEAALDLLDPVNRAGLRGAWARFRLVAGDLGRGGLLRERVRVLGAGALERELGVALGAEVLSLLVLQRAVAADRGERELVHQYREAERRSLGGRFGRLLARFSRQVDRREPAGALAAAARFAQGLASLHGDALGRGRRPLRRGRSPAASWEAAVGAGVYLPGIGVVPSDAELEGGAGA